jgi:hypothetical protein
MEMKVMSKWIYKIERNIAFFPPREVFRGVAPFESEWLKIDPVAGTIAIQKGYAWDGCSPKLFSVLGLFWAGTPDGIMCEDGFTKTGKASLVHDALYQYLGSHGMSRAACDKVFFHQMKDDGFALRHVYYVAVRALGGIAHWLSSKLNKLRTKRSK